MDEIDRELMIFLEKPPGESVESVIERILAAPHEKQQAVKKIIDKLLGEKTQGRPLTFSEAETIGWFALGSLVDLALMAQEFLRWAKPGVESGTVSGQTVNLVAEQFKEMFDVIERRFETLLNGFLKFKTAQGNARFALLQAIDATEDKVFELECEALARGINL